MPKKMLYQMVRFFIWLTTAGPTFISFQCIRTGCYNILACFKTLRVLITLKGGLSDRKVMLLTSFSQKGKPLK